MSAILNTRCCQGIHWLWATLPGLTALSFGIIGPIIIGNDNKERTTITSWKCRGEKITSIVDDFQAKKFIHSFNHGINDIMIHKRDYKVPKG
jgi:hypothetical protein